MANSKGVYIRLFLIFIIGIFIFFHSGTFSVEASSAIQESADSSAKNSELAPLFWTVVFVGGSIAATLSYVSWRKYKGEQKEQMRKDKSVD